MTVFNGSSRPSIRAILIAFGWFSLILGMIGAMVPVMPSMVFLLASLWCFSKGSRRFYTWLYGHRVFGPSLRLWSEHRVIPLRAKLATLSGIAFSVVILVALTPEGSTLLFVYSGINAVAALFIVSRPGNAPATAPDTVPDTAMAISGTSAQAA
jgi:uncharacterized membrane protein YbaN (DUF454 family)